MVEMSVRDYEKRMVHDYGKIVERHSDVIGPRAFTWYRQGYPAFSSTESYSLTESESIAVRDIKDTFAIDELRRPTSGIDFVYGNVGFEAKSSKSFNLSVNQIEHTRVLSYVFIVITIGKRSQVLESYHT